MQEKSVIETIKGAGEDLLEKIEAIIHEGNVRRIVVKQEGHHIAEFPLTVGVIGVVLAPVLAAIGAIAALLTDCEIEIERDEPPTSESETDTSAGGI